MNINEFGKRLLEIRNDRAKKHPEAFNYCKSQQKFVDKMEKESPGNSPCRQVFAKWEAGKDFPNLLQFSLICKLLDCDLVYLLGEQKNYNITSEKVSQYTGLEEEHITSLSHDREFSDFVNTFVFSEKFIELYHSINSVFYDLYIASDLTSHFNADLIKLMKSAFMTTMKNTSAFSDRSELYKKELFNRISPKNYSDFLSGGISTDYKNQIQLQLDEQMKQGNVVSEYEVFINMIAEFSFAPLLCNFEKDQRMGQLSRMFIEIVEKFFEQRTAEIKASIQTKLRAENK